MNAKQNETANPKGSITFKIGSYYLTKKSVRQSPFFLPKGSKVMFLNMDGKTAVVVDENGGGWNFSPKNLQVVA